jgi:YjbE family integral membrane protein
MTIDSTTLFAIAEIIWINLLLSGDNAVVIALACRSLPADQRRLGIGLGAGAAVGLRVVFTAIVANLLFLPFLKIVGGVLLLWIAIKLLIDETEEKDVAAPPKLWAAVRTIALADMVMSLDNVLAIAAAAHGSMALIIFGLLLSVPLIVFGASLIIGLLQRYPAFVWGGAALLGWVAGELLLTDPFWPGYIGWKPAELVIDAVAAAGAIIVVATGWLLRRRHASAG